MNSWIHLFKPELSLHEWKIINKGKNECIPVVQINISSSSNFIRTIFQLLTHILTKMDKSIRIYRWKIIDTSNCSNFVKRNRTTIQSVSFQSVKLLYFTKPEFFFPKMFLHRAASGKARMIFFFCWKLSKFRRLQNHWKIFLATRFTIVLKIEVSSLQRPL